MSEEGLSLEGEYSNDSGRLATWLLIGCVGMVCGSISTIFFCIGSALWLSSPPQNVTLSVRPPTEVELGERVAVEVRIVNNSGDEVKLSSIQIDRTYLNGIVITSSDPEYERTTSFDESSSYYIDYYFDEVIAPNASLTVTFIGESVAAGDYSGRVSVCIDSEFSCIDDILRTTVR